MSVCDSAVSMDLSFSTYYLLLQQMWFSPSFVPLCSLMSLLFCCSSYLLVSVFRFYLFLSAHLRQRNFLIFCITFPKPTTCLLLYSVLKSPNDWRYLFNLSLSYFIYPFLNFHHFFLTILYYSFLLRLYQTPPPTHGRNWQVEATGSAQLSNNYGIRPCMCCIIFSGLT